jgi:putative MFS transporter
MSRVSAMFSGFIVAYMLKVGGVILVIATFGPNVRGKPLDP